MIIIHRNVTFYESFKAVTVALLRIEVVWREGSTHANLAYIVQKFVPFV